MVWLGCETPATLSTPIKSRDSTMATSTVISIELKSGSGLQILFAGRQNSCKQN